RRCLELRSGESHQCYQGHGGENPRHQEYLAENGAQPGERFQRRLRHRVCKRGSRCRLRGKPGARSVVQVVAAKAGKQLVLPDFNPITHGPERLVRTDYSNLEYSVLTTVNVSLASRFRHRIRTWVSWLQEPLVESFYLCGSPSSGCVRANAKFRISVSESARKEVAAGLLEPDRHTIPGRVQ